MRNIVKHQITSYYAFLITINTSLTRNSDQLQRKIHHEKRQKDKKTHVTKASMQLKTAAPQHWSWADSSALLESSERCLCSWQEGWNWMNHKIPSKSSHWMILLVLKAHLKIRDRFRTVGKKIMQHNT